MSLVSYQFVGMTDQSLDTQEFYTIQFQNTSSASWSAGARELVRGRGSGSVGAKCPEVLRFVPCHAFRILITVLVEEKNFGGDADEENFLFSFFYLVACG